MEKLSSILPTSPRVKNVDMTDAHPVRPGTPSYGRPVGISAVRDRLTVSQQARDMAFNETLGQINPKEFKSVKIVEDMNRKFFDTKPVVAKPQAPVTGAESADLEIDGASPELPAAASEPLTSPSSEDAKGASRLDLQA